MPSNKQPKLPNYFHLLTKFSNIKKIYFLEFIRPVCLPSYTYSKKNLENLYGTITGWGSLSDANATESARLNFATKMRVISNTECYTSFPFVSKGHVCIDTHGRRGFCLVIRIFPTMIAFC